MILILSLKLINFGSRPLTFLGVLKSFGLFPLMSWSLNAISYYYLSLPPLPNTKTLKFQSSTPFPTGAPPPSPPSWWRTATLIHDWTWHIDSTSTMENVKFSLSPSPHYQTQKHSNPNHPLHSQLVLLHHHHPVVEDSNADSWLEMAYRLHRHHGERQILSVSLSLVWGSFSISNPPFSNDDLDRRSSWFGVDWA